MRLDRVYIDGFRNLKRLEVDFDERRLTTVVIGQNGAGKSNLIEAIAQIFRWADLRRAEQKYKPRFRYRVEYRIRPRTGDADQLTHVALSNINGEPEFCVNGKDIARAEFMRRKDDWFPDLVFGYYSGSGRRLEEIFDRHQSNYYAAIARNSDESACYEALIARRLFFCRQIHGVLALMALFAFPETKTGKELQERLGITSFHSALLLFREPWYAKGGKASKASNASSFWGAQGPAGRTAEKIKALAFHPLALSGNAIDDYRDKKQDEAQFATFLKDADALKALGSEFSDDGDMFYALEALDVSDLIREVMVWVTRNNDKSGDVGYFDLSDGERQLLMVMGLIRISRGKRVLFLLDEPDTHLNPHWQHSYLELIKEWTGIAADAEKSHIVLTSHNPLTISALTRDEVRVLSADASGRCSAPAPYVDPRGMGFTTTLTEIFGLPTSLDARTQRLVDIRSRLVKRESNSGIHLRRLLRLNDALARLGFLQEDRDPLYQSFLRAMHDVRWAKRPPLTASALDAQHKAMKAIIEQLMAQQGAA